VILGEKLNNFDNNFIQIEKNTVKKETKNLALYFVTTITLYVVLFFFLFFLVWYTAFVTTHSFYRVNGASMKPTLNYSVSDGDQNASTDGVYVDRWKEPEIFDIIVSKRVNENVIKRLMAVEGDYITIAKAVGNDGLEHFYFFRIPAGQTLSDEQARMEETGENGYVIRDVADWDSVGKTYSLTVNVGGDDKTHLYEDGTNSGVSGFFTAFLSEFDANEFDNNYYVSTEGLVYVRVPQGKVFYMGDNRGHSTDCRFYGFVDKEKIVGRVELVVQDFNFFNRILLVAKYYFGEVTEFFAR